MQSVQISQLTIIFIHKMIIDTCPFTYTLWSGDVVSLCHYAYQVCELKIRTSPFDSGIRFFACENREEVIRISVRRNPLCTEKILIEGCDAVLVCCEPTVGESGSGYTGCSAFGFGFAKWCGRGGDWRRVLTEMDSKRIVACRKIGG